MPKTRGFDSRDLTVTRVCEHPDCQNEFHPFRSDKSRPPTRFCSRACSNAVSRSKIQSKATKATKATRPDTVLRNRSVKEKVLKELPKAPHIVTPNGYVLMITVNKTKPWRAGDDITASGVTFCTANPAELALIEQGIDPPAREPTPKKMPPKFKFKSYADLELEHRLDE